MRLIKLMRRSGQYDGIRKLVQTLTDSNASSKFRQLDSAKSDIGSFAAGMHYVRGYVAWYLDNDGSAAVSELRSIHNHDVWGTDALMLMMKIYLFNNAGVSFLDLFHRYTHPQRETFLELSQCLLRELKHSSNEPSLNPTVFTYGCMLLMASGAGDALEKAYNTLRAICKKHPNHVLSHMAFSTCLYLKELPNKAIEFATEFLMKDHKSTRHTQFEHHQQLLLALAQMKLERILINEDCSG